MRVAILALYDFEKVRGGTELFVRHLGAAFPDPVSLTYADCETLFPRLDLSKINLQPELMGAVISRYFAKMHRQNPFDLVICNDVAGLGLKMLAPQVPAIQMFHYTYRGFSDSVLRGQPGFYPSRYLHSSFEKLTSNRKHVVAVSHKTRRELERFYGLSARVIENAVPLDLFKPLPRKECRERLGIGWDGPIGIFVGRADSTKGFDVIRALARKRKDIRILCVTGSPIEDKDLLVARRVRNEDMPYYYSAADFLLSPSRYESASYTTIEAMACDLPIVAFRTGLFEDISGEEVGRILEHIDVDGFSQAIDFVLEHPKVKTRHIAERRFSMDRFLSDYRSLARELVESG